MRKTLQAPFSNVEDEESQLINLERVMEDHNQAAEGCSLPPALDDLALIAAIDGEAGADVIAHLRDCRYCAERAHTFAELQNQLRKQLYRMFCPTSDDLAAYQQGMLAGGQRAVIADHLKECPHCTREFHLLEQLTQQPLPNGSSPPTNGLAATVWNHPRPAVTLRRITTQLLASVFPRPLAGPYGALRGSAHSSHYAYHAENLQLIIGVQRMVHRSDRRVVMGVLELGDDLPAELASATAHLLHNNILIRTARLDELGNFVLDDLAPGTYRLAVRLPDREVIVEALSV